MSLDRKAARARAMRRNCELAREAAFLLQRLMWDSSCPGWREGVGDCEQTECMFCRVKRCVEKLEDL